MFAYNIVDAIIAYISALVNEHCYVLALGCISFPRLKRRCMMIVMLNQNNQTTTSDFPGYLHLAVTNMNTFN